MKQKNKLKAMGDRTMNLSKTVKKQERAEVIITEETEQEEILMEN